VVFEAAQVALTAVILVYASWSDYKTREVSNRVWVVYAPIALALSLAEFLLYAPSQLPLFGLSVAVTVGFAFLLFYTGAFGGADSKAFMCIALSLPFFPIALITPLIADGLSPLSQIIFPITILTNGVLLAAASALYLLIRNLARKASTGQALFEGTLAKESVGKKALVLLTGQKFSLATLKAKWHVYPMEDVVENAEGEVERKIMILPKDEGRDEVVARLSRAAEAGKISSTVWATPGLPMLIFVTVGFVLALFVGDIVWIVVGHLFG
jgi:archaeal preflagellin peptidase FlaK